MKLSEFMQHLAEYDQELEVVVRVSTYTDDPIDDGDILEVRDERSVTVEYAKLTIIADVPED
jgi:hypothetical protein